ncbi:MAG: PQQ-dependent sugar dehydrogenase [Phycisphaerales bacterium]
MNTARFTLVRIAIIALLALGMATPRAHAALPVGFVETVLNIDVNQPVGLTFSASGRMFIWEKEGRVWIVENGVRLPTPLIDISEEVGNWRDFGLLGFAVDPNYESNGRFYLSYVVDFHHAKFFGTPQYSPSANEYFRDTIARVTRYTANAADGFRTADLASRTILIGESLATGIPILHQSHGPGALAFGNDGSLLVSTGDGASFSVADDGGPIDGSSNTALADGIITASQDVGAYRAQQINSLNGKVLRISPVTGDGLADNPFFDAAQPRAARSRVWALGLRNPFRFSVRPDAHAPARGGAPERHAGPGAITIGDNGWNIWEELHVAKTPGQNFGWPLFEGHEPQPLYQTQLTPNPDAPNPLTGGGCGAFVPFASLCVQDVQAAPSFPNPCNPGVQLPGTLRLFEHARPAIDWKHDGGPARAPTFANGSASTSNLGSPGCPVLGTSFGGNSSIGGAWYPDAGPYPSLWRSTYFHADFVAGWIKAFVFDANDNLVSVRDFASNESFSGIVCMAVNPADNLLHLIRFDFGGGSDIIRIDFVSNLPPIVNAAVVGNNFGPSPLSIQFSSAGTNDPEGFPLQYSWDFGDGSPVSTLPNPSHAFTAPTSGPARFDVTLTVTDAGGIERSKSLIVSPNNTPPSVTITSPLNGSEFPPNANTIVPMTADISDVEHPANQRTCAWQVLLHHNTHVHPEPVDNNCASSAPVSGAHGANDEVFYFEFILTVTDAHGLSTTRTVSMFPDLPFCVGDINRDGTTDTRDLVRLLGSFGQSGALGLAGDLNFDTAVNTADLIMFLGNFGCAEP